jgi:hypothetical protein
MSNYHLEDISEYLNLVMINIKITIQNAKNKPFVRIMIKQ